MIIRPTPTNSKRKPVDSGPGPAGPGPESLGMKMERTVTY